MSRLQAFRRPPGKCPVSARTTLALLLSGALLTACAAHTRSGASSFAREPASAESVAGPPRGAEYLEVMRIMQWGASPPSFLADGERFWFVAGPEDSAYIMLVDPERDTVEPLVDVVSTRAALGGLGVALPGRGLPFEQFEWLGDSTERIAFTVADELYVLERGTHAVSRAPDSLVRARARREPRPLRPGLFRYSEPIRELAAPDGRQLATVLDGDLWLRSSTSADSVRVTRDAAGEHSWDLERARWSPDGRYLAAFRVDRTGVPRIPLVNWTEPGSPIEWHPYSMVGEPIPRPELHVVDAARQTHVAADPGSGGEPYIHVAGWDPDGDELYVMRMNRLMDQLDLLAVNPSTGAARPVIAERSETFLWGLPFLHGYTEQLRAQNVATLLSGGRLVWTSERDGRRRLYLHAADGTLLRALTPDSLLVDHLIAVDEQSGWAYFDATRPNHADPYASALYRTGLDDARTEQLLELPELGSARLTRSGRFLVVSRSGLRQPPTLELRRADGSLMRTLWTADASLLESLGWTPPEAFTAKAADGETEIHGLIIRPTNFDPAGRYPVIEHIYAGPHEVHSPRAMWRPDLWFDQWLAEQGFVVVTIDGRGTPARGKAFQDVVHGRLGQFEIADHAAALEQAATTRPWMDLERVGIYGHSMGGYFTIRALLTRPDLYRVGVASAPNIDLSRMRVPMEAFMGCLPQTCPDSYAAGDNTPLAAQLEGRLLILQGTHDTHIPFAESMRMSDAFTRAGKRFDLLVLPGENHTSIFGPHWFRTVGGYLVEHLR